MREREETMRIYLAARYREHPLMREWKKILEADGHEVTSRWINGSHELKDARDDGQRRTFAMEDIADINVAHVVILLSDGGSGDGARGGRHVEFGLALAWGKRIILVGQPENVFHFLSVVEKASTIEEVVAMIRESRLAGKAIY